MDLTGFSSRTLRLHGENIGFEFMRLDNDRSICPVLSSNRRVQSVGSVRLIQRKLFFRRS